MSKGKNYNTGKHGEKSSWEVMEGKGFYRPVKKERANIVKAFALAGKSIEGRGFDLIDAGYSSSLDNPANISAEDIILYELKTAGKKRKTALKENFNGLGFTLTANEEYNHSVLGDEQFKFIFLDLKTDNCMCCNYSDFYEKARVYPTKSIFVKEEILNGTMI